MPTVFVSEQLACVVQVVKNGNFVPFKNIKRKQIMTFFIIDSGKIQIDDLKYFVHFC